MKNIEPGYINLVPYTQFDAKTLAGQLRSLAGNDRSYPSRTPAQYDSLLAVRSVRREQREHENDLAWHYAVVANRQVGNRAMGQELIGTVRIERGAKLYEARKMQPLWLCRLLGRTILPQLTHRLDVWVPHAQFIDDGRRLATAFDLAEQQVKEMTARSDTARSWTLLPETNDPTAITERKAAVGAHLGRFLAGRFYSPGAPRFASNNGLYVSDVASLHEALRPAIEADDGSLPIDNLIVDAQN